MTTRITIRNKLLLAFSLNAFFYALVMYVNLDGEYRLWTNILGGALPVLLSEYIIGSFIVFGWLFLAEYIHEWFERCFGEDVIGRGDLLPNLTAVIVCAAVNVLVNRFALFAIYELQRLLLESPDHSIVSDTEYARMSIRFNYANYVILALFVYYLLTHRRIVQRMHATTLRAEKARKEQAQAQYKLLRNRVNPHFLFNSLSTLASLVHIDGELSERFIDRLSRAYRYMLENRDRLTVPLRAELDFLEAYAFVLQTRFGNNKLRIEAHVPPGIARQAEVVPLTLHVLVERALFNSRMSAQSPLIVEVHATNQELLVKHNLQPRLEPDSSISDWGRNVLEERYALIDPEGRPPRETSDGQFSITSVPLYHTAEGAHIPAQ